MAVDPRRPDLGEYWEPYPTVPKEDTGGTRSTPRRPTQDTQAGVGNIQTYAAETRALGPVYGATTIGAKVDIYMQYGAFIVIRALLGIGPWYGYDQITINQQPYVVGAYDESDPAYQGVWGVDTGTPPFSVTSGEVWKYLGKYYECITTFTATAVAWPYTPDALYSAFFVQVLEGLDVNQYLGTTDQGIDPYLNTAIPGYDETLVLTRDGVEFGLAYLVILLPVLGYSGGFPRVQVRGRFQLVYDPRTSTTAYSDNAALCRADLLSSTVYGPGYTIDNTSLATAADRCDEIVSGYPIGAVGLDISGDPQDISRWDAVLREYSWSWTYIENGTVYFVADDVRAVDHDLTGVDSVPLQITGFRWRTNQERPNTVVTAYTEFGQGTLVTRNTDPIQTAAAEAETESERRTEYSMPGIHVEEQAEAYAAHKLAVAVNEKFVMSFDIAHYGVNIKPGHVVRINKTPTETVTLRVLRREQTAPGRYAIEGQEYSGDTYA